MGSASSRDTHCTVCSFPAGGRNPTFRLGGRLGVENCATRRSRSIVSSFQLPQDPPGEGRCHHLAHLLPAEPGPGGRHYGKVPLPP